MCFLRLKSCQSNSFMLQEKSINNDDPKNVILGTFVSTALIFFSFFVISSWRCWNYIGLEKNSPNTELSYLSVIVILITYIFFHFLLQSLRFLALSLDLVLDCFHFIPVHVNVNIWVPLMTQWRPSLAKYKRTVETGFHFLVLEFLPWAS